MPGGALVTGGRGFVGRHLVQELGEATAPPASQLDLLDAGAVLAAVRELRPEAVFHLAAIASVGESWRDPARVLRDNVTMTVNLLEAVRREAPDARVLLASTGEVYGRPGSLPVDESAPLSPQNPYAVSKAACDLLAGQYAAAHGLRIVRTRAFNHAGPGQSEDYVIGTLTRQVAEAEREGRSTLVLRVGNVDSARDFSDVRDVVRAYVTAIRVEPGVYNVCSGRGTSVRELIGLLAEAARVEVSFEVDPERVRPNDVPEVRGSAERLRRATGWEPEIPLVRTVSDALDHWRQ